MGQKEIILTAMKFDSLTIPEIHLRVPSIPNPQIRIYLKRLIEEGKVKIVGEKDNKKIYRVDNFYAIGCGSPDLEVQDYPDINVDLQALDYAKQLLEATSLKFFSKPKLELFHLGIKNVYASCGMAEGRDKIQPRAIEIVKHLFSPSERPVIVIINDEMPFPSSIFYYTTRFETIYWCEEISEMTSYNLVRKVPTRTIKSNAVLKNGPYTDLGNARKKFDFYSPEELKQYREEKLRFDEKIKAEEKKSLKHRNIFLSNIFRSTVKPQLFQEKTCVLEGKKWYRSGVKGIKMVGMELFPVNFADGEAARSDRFETISREIFDDGTGNDNEFSIILDHAVHKFYCFLFCKESDFTWRGCELMGKWVAWFLENKDILPFIRKYYAKDFWKEVK
jgi:hypothetical protein